MNKDFVEALNELAASRGMDRMELVETFEDSLKQAYEKSIAPEKRIEVHLDPDTGELEVLVVKEVVEKVEDPNTQISLADALQEDPEVELGMEMEFPEPQERFSRIAIQSAKQVLSQKMREAERSIVYNEYKDRVGEVITAQVTRQDNNSNVFVDLGRGEAIMPPKEQIPGERLSVGTRVKVYLAEVKQTIRGPSILASRAAPQLLAYLMKQEVPEIADNVVEIKSIAREPGQRSKIAVYSRSPNVDPIGACIGQRGARIQAVTGELGRERVDVIQWDQSAREFVRNALSPAKAGLIEIEEEGHTHRAQVTVTPDQLSLAIGKGGQNVRLAARLTGFRIDLREAEPTDLDTAMAEATKEKEPKKITKRAAFDALFSASPDGHVTDARNETDKVKELKDEWKR